MRSTTSDASDTSPQRGWTRSATATTDGSWPRSAQSAAPTRATHDGPTKDPQKGARNRRMWLMGARAAGLATLRELQLVELAAQLAHLGALAGDLLAEQPGREEHAAEDEARLDRPSSTGAVRRRRRDASTTSATTPASTPSANSAGAEHAEQQQRLLAEAQLEPHRQHVEHADRNARRCRTSTCRRAADTAAPGSR